MPTKTEVRRLDTRPHSLANTNLLHKDRQIPTALSYVEGEELHGGQAKPQIVRNAKNTVAYFRDFLGQEYGSPFLFSLRVPM